MGGDGESKDEELNWAFYQVGKQVGNSCFRVFNTLHYYISQCQILPFNLTEEYSQGNGRNRV